MEGAHRTAALNQREDRALIGRAARAVLVGAALALRRHAVRLDLAVVGFVHLYDFAFATERRKAASAHCLTQAVHHEPSRFVRNAEHTMHLMGRNALFGS